MAVDRANITRSYLLGLRPKPNCGVLVCLEYFRNRKADLKSDSISTIAMPRQFENVHISGNT
jgi:hypothetical protein